MAYTGGSAPNCWRYRCSQSRAAPVVGCGCSAAERHEGPLRCLAGGLDEGIFQNAVWPHEQHVGHEGPQVEPQLASVALGGTAEVHEVCAAVLDLLGHRPVVDGLAVYTVGSTNDVQA